jgi:hypothetical protein
LAEEEEKHLCIGDEAHWAKRLQGIYVIFETGTLTFQQRKETRLPKIKIMVGEFFRLLDLKSICDRTPLVYYLSPSILELIPPDI